MKTAWIVLLVGTLFLVPIVAQTRASMEAPVVKGTTESIVISARFKGMSAGGSYRIGVGVAKGDLSSAQVDLKREGEDLSVTSTEFKQGYTESWWSVPELSAKGFLVEGGLIPDSDVALVLRADVPRAEADRAERLYVFIAKKYGPTTWYLEDGTEINISEW